MGFFRVFTLLLWAAGGCVAADLTATSDFLRVDPFGAIVEADRGAGGAAVRRITLEGARAGYVSCQIVASVPEGGAYSVAVAPFASGTGIQADLFREWFHMVQAAKRYFPDALIPVRGVYHSSMPEPDNQIPKQTAQMFWLDFWIPAGTAPGPYETVATLQSTGGEARLPIRVNVLAATVPADDAVTMDHNTYGTSWMADQYPGVGVYDLIHAYHRLFYEHRGVFHQLGYGHAGKVGPEFAPRLEGSGASKRVVDWKPFDLHYGPLLDGSAFAGTRRGPHPIPYVYLPVNPEWPASFLWWGKPGYEREFVNVMSEMERHFREKGWTNTRFELFFNHKKRYKGFNWDGDEARFPKDYAYMREYARLMKLAVPAGSPVKFVFRADVSWTMERQFQELSGVVNFWVCGGGMFGWYGDALPELKKRGDIVWTYGGTPTVMQPSSHIAIEVLRQWLGGVDGFVRWLVTDAGKDPWFQFQGGGEALVYPGDRFGIAGPIPSIRLKLERNAVQDVTLLNEFRSKHALGQLRAEAARRFNATTPDEWRYPRPAMAATNPEDWSNATIDDAMPKNPKFEQADAGGWLRVREYVLELAREAQ